MPPLGAIAVVTPDPAQWKHVRAFDEAAEAIHAGLRELGIDCERSIGQIVAARTNVVFGAHLLPAGKVLPPGTVLFNLEQIVDKAIWVTPAYLDLLRRHRVWDYSARNCAALQGLGVSAQHVALGHAAVLERIAAADEDIDILFYGVSNERRLSLLRRLAERGMKVVHANGVYAAERDKLIARARVVLNVHFYEQSRLEVPRCFYLLANGRFVLSELSPDAEETGLAGGMAFAPYEGLESSCARFLERSQERAAIAEAGRVLMRARPQSALLAPVVADLAG